MASQWVNTMMPEQGAILQTILSIAFPSKKMFSNSDSILLTFVPYDPIDSVCIGLGLDWH